MEKKTFQDERIFYDKDNRGLYTFQEDIIHKHSPLLYEDTIYKQYRSNMSSKATIEEKKLDSNEKERLIPVK